MIGEIKKIIHSKLIFFSSLIFLGITLLYVFFGLKGINVQDLTRIQGQMLAEEFHFEMMYYIFPLIGVAIVDFIFSVDIKKGSMKHFILRGGRNKIFVSKMIGMIFLLIAESLLFHFMTFFVLKIKGFEYIQNITKSFFYSIPAIINMCFVFVILSIISKGNNFLYCLLIHFFLLFVTESFSFSEKYLYPYAFKTALHGEMKSIAYLIKIPVLLAISYYLFMKKELTE